MKYLSKLLILSSIIITSLYSCKKDENKVSYEGGTAPSLTASIATNSTIPLDESIKDYAAIKLSWTNPNYQFTTGTNSQDVSYTIEIDTVGANFTNPLKKELLIKADLSKEITVGDLNKYLFVDMKLAGDVNHNIEVRVKSSLGTNGSVPLYSNTLKYTVKPYLIVKVSLPSTGNLYIVGSATPGGWNNPVPTPSQQFTKTSSTTYEITLAMNPGANYLFLPENGSWSKKYAVPDNTVTDLWKGGDFQAYSSGGQDLPGPPVAGNYKITVDFLTGKFTVVKL